MRHIYTAILLVFACTNSYSQIKLPPFAEKLMHKFLSAEVDTSRKPSFLPLPILSYAQETGWEAGVMGLYSFYMDKNDSLIRNSSVGASVSFTTKKQSNFKIISDLWSRNNQYHYTTEVRYRNFPFQYYGVGAHTLADDKQILNEKKFTIGGSIEKKIANNWYTGFQTTFGYYKYAMEDSFGIYTSYPPLGATGGKVWSFGIVQTFDSRNTNTYTTKGALVKLSANYIPNIFGGDNYNGGFADLDARYFTSITPKLVLGFNANAKSYFSTQVPFYLLPQLGSDELMRGYYQGRYRDRNMMAGQTELRYRFSKRFGIVGFGGLGTIFGMEKLAMDNVKPNYGAGFRYFFDIARNLSVRIDYGVGEKHSGEKRQSGWYFSLGEAF